MFHKIWIDKEKKYWMIQFVWGYYLSFGVHIDFQKRYVDLHFLWFIISLGINAPYSSFFESQLWHSRGGLREEDNGITK